MSLQETEKKLYRNEENLELDQIGKPGETNPIKSEENPFASATFQSDLDQRKGVWVKEQEEKKEKRKKLIKKISIIAGAIVGIAGIIWLAFFIRKTAFSEERVKVAVSGPEKVKSSDAADFEISYENLNRASLKDAVLYISYSENFKPFGNLQFETEGPTVSKFNIGKIAGKNSDKVTFRGKFFGPRDALVYMEAKLEYKSSTFNSTFTAVGNKSIFISSSPLAVEVSGPANAAPGNAVSYTITYQNTGQENFNDLKLKAEYPDKFTFSNSEPLVSQGDNIWYVGNLAAGQTGQVKINGILDGARDEEKNLKVFIGEIGVDNNFISYNEANFRTKIISSPIVVSETINGKKENIFVNAGDFLAFKINYKNTGTIGLRDVILTVEANSPVLDYSRIDMQSAKGEFSEEKKIITWRSSEIPGFKTLAPNAEGEVSFSIPVKEIIPVAGSKDKNFSFSAVARMDSPDVPSPEGANKIVASNAVNVKLNSKLLLNYEGFFNDAEISNSGPLPLKVGQETTFTLHTKIANVSNDVTDAKVVLTLAPGTKWKNNFQPRDASVSFNDRANELTWNIGNVPAGMGVITGPKELIYQIGVVPSQNQAGNFALLLSKAIFSAKDTFTGQGLEAKLGEKTSNLTEDLSVGEGGKVSP